MRECGARLGDLSAGVVTVLLLFFHAVQHALQLVDSFNDEERGRELSIEGYACFPRRSRMLRCAVVNRSILAGCVGHAHAVRFTGYWLRSIADRIAPRVVGETAATRQPGANGFLS